jgi:hypothetical protein
MFEQGNAFRKSSMLDPSLFIADTSRDEKIARKLFGDLNCDILGSPGDGKIIILDDFYDDSKAQEGTTTKIESTTAPASIDDAPAKARIDNSEDQAPNKNVVDRDPRGHSVGNP